MILFERGSRTQLVSIDHQRSRCTTAPRGIAEPSAECAAAAAEIAPKSYRNTMFSLGSALISSTLIFVNEGKQTKRF